MSTVRLSWSLPVNQCVKLLASYISPILDSVTIVVLPSTGNPHLCSGIYGYKHTAKIHVNNGLKKNIGGYVVTVMLTMLDPNIQQQKYKYKYMVFHRQVTNKASLELEKAVT